MSMALTLTQKQRELVSMLGNDKRYSLIYGGSRSGKTFLLCYAILIRALKAPGSRHVCLRSDGVDAKQSIGNETLPTVKARAFPDVKWSFNKQDGLFTIMNAPDPEDCSQIWLGGIKDQERLDKLLGKEYATIYLNEASVIRYQAYLQVLTRLSQNVNEKVEGRPVIPLKQKLYVDLNPTTSSHWTYQVFVNGLGYDDRKPIPNFKENYQVFQMNPLDNQQNLSQGYIEELKNQPIANRRRFFEGDYGTDDPYALWNRDMIVVRQPTVPYEMVVVAVDPAITSTTESDETGIIAAGITRGPGGVPECYILEDASNIYTPIEWGNKAVELYNRYNANFIIGETNQGGDLVRRNIGVSANNIPIMVRTVHASNGKVTRAEPISNLYAQGRVFHVRNFRTLEDQMCSFKSNFNRQSEGYSPDRVDALVYAVTALLPEINGAIQINTPPVIPTHRSSLSRR